jgi:uncharacterized protein
VMPTRKELITAVWDAIHDSDCAQLDAVLAAGLDVNFRSDGDKWNMLHMALVSVTTPPDPHVIRHLIEIGVGVNAKDRCAWTPLHFAVRTKSGPVVKMLIDAGAEPNHMNDDGLTPLHQSFLRRTHDLEMIEALLRAGADPDYRGSASRKFLATVACTDKPEVQALLEKYAPSSPKQT